ncbi:hypothetical protein JCM19039_1319 [Geomicrobium sp. JCM 19039]|nr:hypothetical protein JCM19039_1319 [Geomicrobium sp. JCM 19039]
MTDDQEIILIDEGPAEVSFFDDNDNELLVLSFTVNHYETYDNETIDTETSGTIEQSNASTWISSSPDIIEVDDEGSFNALEPGDTTLMAYDENEQLVAIYEYSVTGIAQPGNELPATSNYLQFSSYWERADRDDITDHVAFTSRQPGDSVRFQFQGTGFQWYGVRDQYTGLATIYLNGEEIDTLIRTVLPKRMCNCMSCRISNSTPTLLPLKLMKRTTRLLTIEIFI